MTNKLVEDALSSVRISQDDEQRELRLAFEELVRTSRALHADLWSQWPGAAFGPWEQALLEAERRLHDAPRD